MVKQRKQEEKLLKESEEFILKMLKPMLSMDMDMIQEERDEEDELTGKIKMALDDPKRNEMSLRLNSVIIPFPIPKNGIEDLKLFFEEKGWEFVGMTSTPSIKLKKIQPQK